MSKQQKSIPLLPRITTNKLEELFKSNNKNNKQLKWINRNTHIPGQGSGQLNRVNRLTDLTTKIDKHDFIQHTYHSVEVKSPFYKRLDNSSNKKCDCQYHRMKKLFAIPQIRRSQHSPFDSLKRQKFQQMKKYNKCISETTKNNHKIFNKTIDHQHQSYIARSSVIAEHLKKSRADHKFVNSTHSQERLQQIVKQKVENNLWKAQFFKKKLADVYQLDDINKPFQSLLNARSNWEQDKKIWGKKILKYIIGKTKKYIYSTKKNKKANQHQQSEQFVTDGDLAYIQQNLAIILNNMTSIDDLILDSQENNSSNPSNDSGESFSSHEGVMISNQGQHHKAASSGKQKMTSQKRQIHKILTRVLRLEGESMGQKVVKNMGNIIKDIIKQQKQSEIRRLQELKAELKRQQSLNENAQQSIHEQGEVASRNNISNTIQSSQFNQSTNTQSDQINVQKEQQQACVRSTAQRLSIISTKSIASRRFSKLSKQSILLSNNLISRRETESDEKMPILQGKERVTSHKLLGLKSRHRIEDGFLLDRKQDIFKKSHKNSPSNTPSLGTNQIISQKQELNLPEQSDDQVEKKKKLTQQQMLLRQDEERVNGIIDFIKSRRKHKEYYMNKEIPQKYKHINYQRFCTRNCFVFIISQIGSFVGQQKFKFQFLFNQLQLKRHILEDQYMQDLINEFSPLFSTDSQLENWKTYLIEHRTRLMIQKLNRQIDIGICQIQKSKLDQALATQKVNIQKERQAADFKNYDESQAAYDRYIQKIQRKQSKTKERQGIMILKQRDLNQTNQLIKNLALMNPAEGTVSQILTQRTITSKIGQQDGTRGVYYDYVQHPRQQIVQRQTVHRDPGTIKASGDTKKVLKYMLARRPKYFEMLNKDVTALTNLVQQGGIKFHRA